MVVVWGLGGDIIIVRYAQKQCSLSVIRFFNSVIAPVLGVAIVMLLMGCAMMFLLDDSFLRLLACCLLTTLGMLISFFSFGLTKEELSKAVGIIRK